MKVIIPLAGFGTRLGHKPIPTQAAHQRGCKTVLGHILDKFAGLDVEEFIIVHGYLGEQIQEYMASSTRSNHTQFVEQKELIARPTRYCAASHT